MKARLVMFVHGLGGAGRDTWRLPGQDGFPELIAGDRVLQQEADFAFFEYPTSLFRLPFTSKALGIRDLAEGLKAELDITFAEYESITLVAHSLGGLVVRKYVLEEAKLGRRLRVDKILLYAVPNHGSTLGTIGNFVSWQHNQLRQLCMNSDYLEELNADWKNFKMMDKVQICFVVGGQDRAVSKQSAVEQWGEERVHYVLDADHRTIVKPQRADSLSYRIFRQFLLGPVRVFLSVGGGRTPGQDRFVEAVQTLCRSRNLDARTVDQYSTTNRQPLKDVEYRMDRCFGAIVLAFERAHVDSGMWRRGVPQLATPMNDVRLPTVWNQIEAAMAYSRGLPLLVLAEHGLHSEGMLESKYDWRVKWVDLSTFSIDDPEFNGMFEDWRGNVVVKRDGAIATG